MWTDLPTKSFSHCAICLSVSSEASCPGRQNRMMLAEATRLTSASVPPPSVFSWTDSRVSPSVTRAPAGGAAAKDSSASPMVTKRKVDLLESAAGASSDERVGGLMRAARSRTAGRLLLLDHRHQLRRQLHRLLVSELRLVPLALGREGVAEQHVRRRVARIALQQLPRLRRRLVVLLHPQVHLAHLDEAVRDGALHLVREERSLGGGGPRQLGLADLVQRVAHLPLDLIAVVHVLERLVGDELELLVRHAHH